MVFFFGYERPEDGGFDYGGKHQHISELSALVSLAMPESGQVYYLRVCSAVDVSNNQAVLDTVECDSAFHRSEHTALRSSPNLSLA